MPKEVLFTFTSNEVTWYQMQLCPMRKTTVVSIFEHIFHLITWLKLHSPHLFIYFQLNEGLILEIFLKSA